MKKILFIKLILFLCFNGHCNAETIELPFANFIEQAISNDTEFEQILIDELTLQYKKDKRLPAKDLVLSVKHEHEFFFNQDRESPDTTIELSKLFPYIGTDIAADYSVGSSISSDIRSSSASFTIAQSIAQNAFGRSTRLLDKIVDIENDIARHQIVEAYEDYLATISLAYYTWYEDYQNFIIGEASYKENVKLLDNIKDRQNQKIALPIDVNKVKLQVLAKKERLIKLEEEYQNSSNIIKKIIRGAEDMAYIPKETKPLVLIKEEFKSFYNQFVNNSRTFQILRKMENKSSLIVARDADDLLPSIDFITGYEVSGEDSNINNHEDLFYIGISLDFPFFDQVDQAEYNISKIEDSKQKLSTVNTYYRLHTQLLSLYLEIDREKKLIAIADERISLAQSILKDEQENYSFGKITLNDYIQAFNTLDENRFNKIFHEIEYRKLLTEWLRLSDQLVKRKEVEQKVEKLRDNM